MSEPGDADLGNLLAKARDALDRDGWHEAEAIAGRILDEARTAEAFDVMVGAVRLLRSARQGRRAEAARSKGVRIIDEPFENDLDLGPGRYLVQPPLVGADARRLRAMGLQQKVSVLVLCREPLTNRGEWPVVAIGTGTTVRIRIDPPRHPERPDRRWFDGTMRAMGNAALSKIDPTMPLMRRIGALAGCLDSVPEHDGLHDGLEAACFEAMKAADA